MEAIDRALVDIRERRILAPERSVTPLGPNGALLCMPASATDLGVVKVITVHPGNHLKTIQGELIVFDAVTGRQMLILDGPTVTARRTAAVTLAGLRALSVRPRQAALLIGAGAQARAHAEALAEIGGVSQIGIASPGARSASLLAAHLARAYPALHIKAFDSDAIPASSIDSADVVISLTTARKPIIPSDTPDSTTIVAVGAYQADMVETPAEIVRRRRVVVDHLGNARAEAGDLIQAGIDWDQVEDLVQACAQPARHSTRPLLFKTIGHACWDLAAARVAVAHIGASREA